MVYLTRRVTFNAAHKLYVEQWTPEKNKEVFGKCANSNWHGHNYQLFVTVKAKPDPQTGFVVDAKWLGSLIKQEVSEVLDHSNLNLDIPWLEGIQPTSENIAIAIWKRLEDKFSNCKLHAVKLVETENISVEYFGE